MDSGEINKILGGVLGAVLVFLLLGFFSNLIYFGPGGHEDEDRTLAFAVEVEETGGGGGEEEAIDFGALLASADASAGPSVFNKCQACHNLEDGANAVGPHLHNVVGRDIASVEGFAYSDALTGKEGDWDLVNLFSFIHNPSGWAPGTTMGFAGLPDNQDKVDLIVWLNEQGDAPVELVAPEMPETAAAEGTEGEEAAEGEATAEAGDPHAELIAAADPAAGETVFRKCQACHRLEEGQNLVGPHLYGVVGREIASVEGFQYSDALTSKEGAWEFDSLFDFLHDPQGWAPGTIMGFAGLEDDQDKADVIAYMNEQSDVPVELGGAAAAEGDTAAQEPAAEEDAAAEEPAAEEDAAAAPAAEGDAAAEDAEGEDGAVAAASGAAPEQELLETAEEAGKEDTEERDALDEGVPSAGSDVKEVDLADEEEAEAKLDAAAEGGDGDAERYSEQQSGTDELEPGSEPEGAAPGTEGTDDDAAEAEGDEAAADGAAAEGEAAAAPDPGSAAPAEPEEIVDPEVETSAEVEANPTTALTEVLDEDRVDPLPEAEEEAAGEAAVSDELMAMLAAADPAAGEQVFNQCQACHRLEDGQNLIGPHLYGVVGRGIASVESYSYSPALAGKEGRWDPETLDAFLADPLGWAPGTKMGYAGLDDPQGRADLIAYLNRASDEPMQFGAAEGSDGTAAARPPADAE